MTTSPTIGQEFYKIRDTWATADADHSWKLAIWQVQYADVEIIDKFLETERTAIGVFPEIFFRFDSPYQEDYAAYEQALWQEYLAWFEPIKRAEYDVYGALKKDGLLKSDYEPDRQLPPTVQSIWKELRRLMSHIHGLEDTGCCIYFPPLRPDQADAGPWYTDMLKKGMPPGIRLVTIDITNHSRITIPKIYVPQVKLLQPALNMVAAINNDMDKGGGNSDTISIDARFRKQIRKVMDCTTQSDTSLLDTEITTLLQLSKKMGGDPHLVAGWMIAAQAYFMIRESDKSAGYADKAIRLSRELMDKQDPAGYPTWKSCIMIRAAILVGKKKRKQAIALYEALALEAVKRGDAFMIMEGYRLSGHLYYELGQMNIAFENELLAISGGSYLELEVRRQSTFLHAAAMAVHLCEKVRGPEDLRVLQDSLQELLGADWATLLQSEGMEHATARRKSTLFEFN
ncbi:tetratricopeptide repeat protein [Chitinophaga arvensicola]|uniref:MalT-like TPR region domain-containing protein n=1 Tax=Chitinophaga arvensicola TaxID=29529 RepID=A0A1I0SBY7_9BACT|nr:hypothetical protein [Chitinophaga arvensicola]SEW54501.1 hypothetical protein SAMN04488122_6056 [Chitinophaga arvensicola]